MAADFTIAQSIPDFTLPGATFPHIAPEVGVKISFMATGLEQVQGAA